MTTFDQPAIGGVAAMNIDGCAECIHEAEKAGVSVDWWCWMFGCCPACDCYGREDNS